MEAIRFNGAKELLKFQVIKARSLFYLGASEAAHGSLSFDDFEAVCISGQVVGLLFLFGSVDSFFPASLCV